MSLKTTLASAALIAATVLPAAADNLSLAYFMGANHPMNKAFLTPMGEQIEAATNGSVTVQHFPGGALNASPPRQYSILLDGVADIVFMDPSATSRTFPRTSTISLPNLCFVAETCTEMMHRAQGAIEKDYQGKVMGLWTASPPVLITRDVAVREIADVKGLKIRVTDPTAIPFVEALGASAIAMPVTEVNQALANGVVDAVMIDPSSITTFKLFEPGNYITTWFPGGPATFAVVMNKGVYEGLSDEERAAVDKVAASDLSIDGARMFREVGEKAMVFAAQEGLEIIEFSSEERARIDAIVADVMAGIKEQPLDDGTYGDLIAAMQAE